MKIVYDEKKTVERITEVGELRLRAKARRNAIRLVNLLVVLSILAVVVAYYVTGNSMPIATGIGFIVALVFSIISLIYADKMAPKDISPLMWPAAWYHVIADEYTVLEVKAEKEGERYRVDVVAEVDGAPKNIPLGTYDVRKNSEVEEETLDLEQEVVFVPATDVSDAE